MAFSMIIPVILCGGAGSRLWPASRESYPKQLFAFGGGRSLFQETLARVSGAGFAPPIIVTGNDYRFLVAEQLQDMGVAGDIVLEPMRRDSCAAIAAAAAMAVARAPDALVLVLAADHAIPDLASFHAHIARGQVAAEAGRIVTFGIKPTFPATGYGYIRPGAPLPDAAGVNAIAAFVEKPDEATARRYLAEGYVWNSGNFLFSAAVFLEELARLAPDVHAPAVEAVAKASRDLDFIRLDAAAFARAKPISVDYAVMEKTSLAALVPSDFAWSDIGSWSAVWDMAAKDGDGNAAEGDAVFENAKGNYVYSPDRLAAIVGLDDIVVVTTRDAVLVAAKDQSEAVKTLVSRLGKAGRREVSEHVRRYQPWGDVEVIDEAATFQVRRVRVKPGGQLALQSHQKRSEHWVIVSGTAQVTLGTRVDRLEASQSVFIPAGMIHRLENAGDTTLELIEVQSGTYLGEDDVIRHGETGQITS